MLAIGELNLFDIRERAIASVQLQILAPQSNLAQEIIFSGVGKHRKIGDRSFDLIRFTALSPREGRRLRRRLGELNEQDLKDILEDMLAERRNSQKGKIYDGILKSSYLSFAIE
ncbi:hypothetical protein [Microcoleus sp. POL10_C6]|uniref:hypothetical protein n=1 Tax=Microcoleus sp. POL10_C6 TaxID=2818852 RepID=UPI002FD2E3A6